MRCNHRHFSYFSAFLVYLLMMGLILAPLMTIFATTYKTGYIRYDFYQNFFVKFNYIIVLFRKFAHL